MLAPTSVGRLVDPSRKPHARSRQCHRAESIEKARQVIDLAGFSMVGVARIELATPAMSTQCSTTELHAHGSWANSRGWWGVQARNSLKS